MQGRNAHFVEWEVSELKPVELEHRALWCLDLNAHHLKLGRALSMLVHRRLAGFYKVSDTVFC